MKFAMTLPYGDHIFDHEDAIKLVEIMERAERYEMVYHPAEEGGSTHHVYREPERGTTLKHISPDLYEIARMAGKPNK
jgi:hypothetical protein